MGHSNASREGVESLGGLTSEPETRSMSSVSSLGDFCATFVTSFWNTRKLRDLTRRPMDLSFAWYSFSVTFFPSILYSLVLSPMIVRLKRVSPVVSSSSLPPTLLVSTQMQSCARTHTHRALMASRFLQLGVFCELKRASKATKPENTSQSEQHRAAQCGRGCQHQCSLHTLYSSEQMAATKGRDLREVSR